MARVHVTFGWSAAHSLRLALRELSRDELVVPFVTDLNLGPIDPADPTSRRAWCAEHFGIDDDDDTWAPAQANWSQVIGLPVDTEIIAWLSRHSASEYCGLLELLWHRDRVSAVDVADLKLSRSFGSLRREWILEHGLVDRAQPVSEVARARYRRDWAQLRAENADARVLTDARLISVTIDHVDELIRSFITSEWRSCTTVVAHAIGTLQSGTFDQSASDMFVYQRLLDMIDEDTIEGETDDDWQMRESRVRLGRPRT